MGRKVDERASEVRKFDAVFSTAILNSAGSMPKIESLMEAEWRKRDLDHHAAVVQVPPSSATAEQQDDRGHDGLVRAFSAYISHLIYAQRKPLIRNGTSFGAKFVNYAPSRLLAERDLQALRQQ